MPILKFEQFQLNEDNTANLIQQKNSLTQQINDLQKKLLDVQQQIVTAQKQTLAQNPQTQIPMTESVEDAGLPKGAIIQYANYHFPGKFRKTGELYVRFKMPDSSEEHEAEAYVDDFEEFLERYALDVYSREDLQRYVETEQDEDGGTSHHFNLENFWQGTDDGEKVVIVHDYLKKHNAI